MVLVLVSMFLFLLLVVVLLLVVLMVVVVVGGGVEVVLVLWKQRTERWASSGTNPKTAQKLGDKSFFECLQHASASL